jgi:hypothetical protein
MMTLRILESVPILVYLDADKGLPGWKEIELDQASEKWHLSCKAMMDERILDVPEVGVFI